MKRKQSRGCSGRLRNYGPEEAPQAGAAAPLKGATAARKQSALGKRPGTESSLRPSTSNRGDPKAGSSPAASKSIGEIHKPRTLFLRNHVGEATRGKLSYKMSTLMIGTPVVQSCQTGQWFTLSWENILELARAAGIDVLKG